MGHIAVGFPVAGELEGFLTTIRDSRGSLDVGLMIVKMCVPPVMATPFGTPMVGCSPQWLPPNTRPKPVDHPSPFSASTNQPVLTVHHLLRANKDITLNVNPSIAVASAGSTFPLIADLRVAPELKVWVMPKKGEEKKVEMWKGSFFDSLSWQIQLI